MKNRNNWHILEESLIRNTWLSESEAKELLARYQSCFPDISFTMFQANNTNELPGVLNEIEG